MLRTPQRGRSHGLPLLATLMLGAVRLCAQAPVAPEPATYIGTEMCQACHDAFTTQFQKNPHWALESDTKKGWEGRSCESCHGPGSKHMESLAPENILNPAKLAPMAADEGCLSCHLHQSTQTGRIRGGHGRNQVSCATCHPVHGNEDQPLQPHPAARINQQCAGCHTSAWTSFQRPHAHRVAEGAMSCVDCHNPHGSFVAGNMRTAGANEPGCLSCHGNLRGPFVYEHAPVRLEGCQSCHEPHGSANPRMLVRHEVSTLCLECHANVLTGGAESAALGGIPPAFHDTRSPRFRNCTLCHVKIHGSHVSPDFLR